MIQPNQPLTKGLTEMAGEVLNETVVHLINFVAGQESGVTKPPLR